MTCFVPIIQLADGNTIIYCYDASYIIKSKENKILFTSEKNAILKYFKEKENIGLTEAICSYNLPFFYKEYSYETRPIYNTMTSYPMKFINALKKECTIEIDNNSRFNNYYPVKYYIDSCKCKISGERVCFDMYIDDKEKIMKICVYCRYNDRKYFRTREEAEASYNKSLSCNIIDFEPTKEERIAEENKAKKEAILKKIEELKEEANKL